MCFLEFVWAQLENFMNEKINGLNMNLDNFIFRISTCNFLGFLIQKGSIEAGEKLRTF